MAMYLLETSLKRIIEETRFRVFIYKKIWFFYYFPPTTQA
jgi:hypothetical protein